jgi:hypothetical protein
MLGAGLIFWGATYLTPDLRGPCSTQGLFLFWMGLGFAMATTHVLFTRWINGPERWRVRQHSEVLVEIPAAEALERCTEAVEGLPHFKRLLPGDGEAIEARTRMTFWSCGERIACRAVAMDERHTRVLVSSRPVAPTAIVDNGRNWANILLVRRALAAQG